MTEIETLFNGRYLRMKRKGTWEYVERTNPGGAVIIVALTAEDKLLLVEQFRMAIGRKTIEMPAGLVGDIADQQNENVLEAASRELLEETGYAAGRLEYLMAGPSSSGMSTEVIAFVRAYNLIRVHAGGGDASENITVHEVPRKEAAGWLWRKIHEGYSIDPKLFAGLYFLDHGAELWATPLMQK
jgi:ADP-ribose pyrophosphatase